MRGAHTALFFVIGTVGAGLVPAATQARSAAAISTPPDSFCGERTARDATQIRCSDDKDRDYAPLALFPKLERLSLAGATNLHTLRQLPGLSSLRTLDVRHTPIAELTGVEQLPQLQELRADWTWVRALGPLAGLRQLRVLSLSHTPVEDLTPIGALAELESIELCDTRVRDLGPLAALGKLREIRLCETPADASALRARRPGLKVVTGAPAAEEPGTWRLVTTEAGTPLLNSLNERFATQTRPAAWFASPQYGGTWHIRRRLGGLREGYHVQAAALRDVQMHQVAAAWLVPPSEPAVVASLQTCRTQGLCNVELRAGGSVPAGALWTGVIAAADLAFATPWRLCRRGGALEARRSGPDWLAPAAGDQARTAPLSFASDQVRITAEQHPAAPPPCAAGAQDAAAAAAAAARKTVPSGRAPAPTMGIFLLRQEDADGVDRIGGATERFAKAAQLAVKQWVYPDRWCDDAVHQAMLLLGEPTPTMTPDEARRRYLSTIVARHNEMYREYDQPGCERALDRMLTAKQLAQRHGYRYYQFGY